MFDVRRRAFFLLLLALGLTLGGSGCGTDVLFQLSQGQLLLQISVNPGNLVLVIGGEAQAVEVSVARRGDTGPVNLSLSGVPAGVPVAIEQPGILTSGQITFRAGSEASPQSDVQVTITASDGVVFDTQEIRLTIVPP